MSRNQLQRAVEGESLITWSFRNRRIRYRGSWQPFTLKRYPFLVDLYRAFTDSNTERIVIMKPTQVGLTEFSINSSLFWIDQRAGSVLYMLPTDNALSDFSSARLTPLLNNSPYVGNMFQNADNVGLKVGKSGSLYLRGSNSASKLEEIAVSLLVRDELDRFNQENAELAKKRLGAAEESKIIDLGHPTFEGGPIHQSFKDSSRDRWMVRCGNCGELQEPSFFANYWERDRTLGCRACSQDWDKSRLYDGDWYAENPNHPVKGYTFNKMLSPTESLEEIAEEYEKAVDSGGYKLTQFYNTALGEPYSAEGDRLTKAKIHALMYDYRHGEKSPQEGYMGVDVGNKLHYLVMDENYKVYKIGKAGSFDDLYRIVDRFNVKTAVVDAMPETRRARDWCDGLPKGTKGYICRRSATLESEQAKSGDQIKVNQVEQIDRFMALFENEKILLPKDLSTEVIEDFTSAVRVIEEDGKGRPKASWNKNGFHYGDAGSYALEALESGPKQARVFGKSDKKKKGIVPRGKDVRVAKIGIFG